MVGVGLPRPLEGADRVEDFDCGRESLNAWLRRHAWHNQSLGVSRTSVVSDASGAIVGFVSLSAAQIERAALPKPRQRNKPDPVPAILLGQVAVRRDRQGEGHARSLLYFALSTAVRASNEIGVFAVITHPLDDSLRAFYSRWGFVDLPGDPGRGMIVRIADLKAAGFGA